MQKIEIKQTLCVCLTCFVGKICGFCLHIKQVQWVRSKRIIEKMHESENYRIKLILT